MSSQTRIRRGLPRISGGEPWPPVAEQPPVVDVTAAAVTAAEAPAPASAELLAAAAPAVGALRRGLPRAAGGEPWPPAGAASAVSNPSAVAPVPEAPAAAVSDPVPAVSAPVAAQAPVPAPAGELRRGLPRVKGGEPWPTVVVPSQTAPQPEPAPPAAVAEPAPPAAVAEPAPSLTPVEPAQPMNPAQPARPAQAQAAASSSPEKGRLGKVWPLPIKPWMGTAALAIVALELVGLVVVLAARGLMQLDGVQEFVARYPGHPSLPASAPIGVPAWLGWQHFFNAFLMVLIIRTGLTIRRETKPEAYWASARKAGKKVSLTIWFHQGLDLLWVLNGLVFFVLLFATGQWMRIVPTSWDVIPNALSAGLQYATLNWPTENGWVHYNALQMLAYFVTVFIAAPLAVVSGFRMSTVWPEGNKKLSQAYPIETARKIHFPVMLYFVAFIAVHVFLVFTTGALRNLNHMYAAQGSSDPAAYAADWTGFLLFLVSLAVIAAAWFAARPLVIAPIARLFGKVSSR